MSTVGARAIAVNMRRPEMRDPVCTNWLECIHAPPEVLFFGALFLLVSVGLVAATLGYIRQAHSVVEEETQRTKAEQEAFTAFIEQVKAIGANTRMSSPPIATGGIQLQAAESRNESPTAIEQIKAAYRETVMDVPHYEIYNESLAENMYEELGPEVTTALLEGDQFSPQVKQGVLQKAHEARHQRQRMLELYAREREALTDTEDQLKEIQTEHETGSPESLLTPSFEELVDQWEWLENLEQECQVLIETRQDQLRTAHRVENMDIDIVLSYVYEPLSVRLPVFAEVATVLEELHASKSNVVTAITRRA